jgi:NADPH:quinone reductase-like Zn-dependent oxidoreductase
MGRRTEAAASGQWVAMKAIRIHRTGGPSVLKFEEVEQPTPRRGQLLIEVHAAGVNPVDARIRQGGFKMFKAVLPAVLGRDMAGVVRRVAGSVTGFRAGDAVFGMLDLDRGAYAQFTLASPREIAHRPRGLRELEAGSIGVAALTAWQGLFDHGKLKKGQRVLIHGAAGGVGHFAVQFARVRGATVIATASRRDLGWVKSLGAEKVIDYRNEKFENETGNIDLVLDLIAGETQARSWAVLKPRGGAIVSTLTQPSKAEARRHRARAVRMMVKVKRRQLDEIARLIVAKKVKVTLGRIFPLSKARQAQELVENGHVRGKVVLAVPRPG